MKISQINEFLRKSISKSLIKENDEGNVSNETPQIIEEHDIPFYLKKIATKVAKLAKNKNVAIDKEVLKKVAIMVNNLDINMEDFLFVLKQAKISNDGSNGDIYKELTRYFRENAVSSEDNNGIQSLADVFTICRKARENESEDGINIFDLKNQSKDSINQKFNINDILKRKFGLDESFSQEMSTIVGNKMPKRGRYEVLLSLFAQGGQLSSENVNSKGKKKETSGDIIISGQNIELKGQGAKIGSLQKNFNSIESIKKSVGSAMKEFISKITTLCNNVQEINQIDNFSQELANIFKNNNIGENFSYTLKVGGGSGEGFNLYRSVLGSIIDLSNLINSREIKGENDEIFISGNRETALIEIIYNFYVKALFAHLPENATISTKDYNKKCIDLYEKIIGNSFHETISGMIGGTKYKMKNGIIDTSFKENGRNTAIFVKNINEMSKKLAAVDLAYYQSKENFSAVLSINNNGNGVLIEFNNNGSNIEQMLDNFDITAELPGIIETAGAQGVLWALTVK